MGTEHLIRDACSEQAGSAGEMEGAGGGQAFDSDRPGGRGEDKVRVR